MTEELIYRGDTPTIKLDTEVDLTEATLTKIFVLKPDLTEKEWTPDRLSVPPGGSLLSVMEYDCQPLIPEDPGPPVVPEIPADLDIIGLYIFTPYAEWEDGTKLHHCKPGTVVVKEPGRI